MSEKPTSSKRSPWAWIPTLYFAQGLPYVAVMTITVIMYKRLGMSNTDIALYTGWLGLPWVIKPFWSPFIDIFKTKRWWILTMQWLVAIALAAIAFTIPTSWWVQLTLAIFMLMGFASATHDIAVDGFYMLALTEHEQSLFVGIRSTFYRIATVAGQGLLVILAGLIEMNSGLEPMELNITVDPATTTNVMQTNGDRHNQALAFVPSANDITLSTKAPATINTDSATIDYAEYISARRAYIDSLNISNGFYAREQVATSATGAKDTTALERFIIKHFGETKTEGKAINRNTAIVEIKLSQKPEDGKSYVFIVSQSKGTTDVQLDAAMQRFEVNSGNWDKPMYLLFTVDPKVKEKAQATFIGTSGNIPMAWMIVFATLSIFFFIIVIYHTYALPKPTTDSSDTVMTPKAIIKDFINTFKTFFTKFPLWQTIAAIAFMLLYRFPEAQLTKIIMPFLIDPIDKGGLALSTGEVGLVYGTVGIIGLTLGGIIGGIVAAKGGLKRWLLPMAWSMSLTCLTFVYLAFTQDQSLLTINICVFIEQFGYGFGFTAYMLYLIYYSEGKYKTAHYAICTGFMALSMMMGMMAGWLQDMIGYKRFFVWTIICCIFTIGAATIVKVDPNFGRKKD